MSKGARVIEGGGRTDVTNSANPDAFPAENGIFAEFSVPLGLVFSVGQAAWPEHPDRALRAARSFTVR
jgi:hypothetical protein